MQILSHCHSVHQKCQNYTIPEWTWTSADSSWWLPLQQWYGVILKLITIWITPCNKLSWNGKCVSCGPDYLHNNVLPPKCLLQTLSSKPTILTPLQKSVRPMWRLTTSGIWRCTFRQLLTRTHEIISHKTSSHHHHDSLKTHTTFKINFWFSTRYTVILLKCDSIHKTLFLTLTNTILIICDFHVPSCNTLLFKRSVMNMRIRLHNKMPTRITQLYKF